MKPTASKYLHNNDNKISAKATLNLSAYQDKQIMQNRK
jgi:hypothetical protein